MKPHRKSKTHRDKQTRNPQMKQSGGNWDFYHFFYNFARTKIRVRTTLTLMRAHFLTEQQDQHSFFPPGWRLRLANPTIQNKGQNAERYQHGTMIWTSKPKKDKCSLLPVPLTIHDVTDASTSFISKNFIDLSYIPSDVSTLHNNDCCSASASSRTRRQGSRKWSKHWKHLLQKVGVSQPICQSSGQVVTGKRTLFRCQKLWKLLRKQKNSIVLSFLIYPKVIRFYTYLFHLTDPH